MKRILLTITFLVLPTAAVAEIYFCESTHSTLLGYNEDEPFSLGGESDDYRITVDTTQGFRVSLDLPGAPNRPDYRGSCIKLGGPLSAAETITCVDDRPLPGEEFSLQKREVRIFPNGLFWFIDTTLLTVTAVQGFCQEA